MAGLKFNNLSKLNLRVLYESFAIRVATHGCELQPHLDAQNAISLRNELDSLETELIGAAKAAKEERLVRNRIAANLRSADIRKKITAISSQLVH
jgi:hypothetical protein